MAETKIKKQGLNVSAWHIVGGAGEPAFENSWANYDASAYDGAGFMLDAMGFVHLRGFVRAGTIGDVPIFTLPVGYRPLKGQYMVVITNSGIGSVHVGTDGKVKPESGTNIWFSLAGLNFSLEA